MHMNRPCQKSLQSFKLIGIKLYEELQTQGTHRLSSNGQMPFEKKKKKKKKWITPQGEFQRKNEKKKKKKKKKKNTSPFISYAEA